VTALTADQLVVGRVYRAKRPAPADRTFSNQDGFYNDRQVVWIGAFGTEVQYDGPAVANGRHLPKIAMDAFLKWADKDVTDQLPAGAWQTYGSAA
jgi:hypothetical protein